MNLIINKLDGITVIVPTEKFNFPKELFYLQNLLMLIKNRQVCVGERRAHVLSIKIVCVKLYFYFLLMIFEN